MKEFIKIVTFSDFYFKFMPMVHFMCISAAHQQIVTVCKLQLVHSHMKSGQLLKVDSTLKI